MRVSIIIPAVDEAGFIGEAVRLARAGRSAEIIVVDGGSADGTAAIAEAEGARVIRTGRGRARQQNAGAAEATGDALLFLHADTQLPANAAARAADALSDARVALGAFSLGFDRSDWGTRLLVFGADLRMRLLRLPYGDQALFLRRETFGRLGGFRDIPIMEDVCLVRRAKRLGRVVVLPERVRTSPRAYDRYGLIRNMLWNWRATSLFALGVGPEKLVSRGR
jgi:rSAM/selenodomain-associated transferase 2